MAKLMSFFLKKGAIDVLLMSKRLTLTSVATVIYLLKWLNMGLLARLSSNPKIYNSYLGKAGVGNSNLLVSSNKLKMGL